MNPRTITRKEFDRIIRDTSVTDLDFYMLATLYRRKTIQKLKKIEAELKKMKTEWNYRYKLIKKVRPRVIGYMQQNVY